jgi:hypothetical protein
MVRITSIMAAELTLMGYMDREKYAKEWGTVFGAKVWLLGVER